MTEAQSSTETKDTTKKPVNYGDWDLWLLDLVRNPGKWTQNMPQLSLTFFALGLGLVLLTGIGHVAAIGFPSAARLYWKYWTFTPLVGLFSPFAMVLGVCLLQLPAFVLFELPVRLLPPSTRQVVRKGAALLVQTLFMGGFAAFIVWAVYASARTSALQRGGDPATSTQIQGAIKEQEKAALKLSESATALLAELDATAADLARSKESLRATLVAAETQRARINAAASEVSSLIQKEETLTIQSQRLRDLLGGKEPLTVDYFDRAGFWGYVIGILGLAINVPPLVSWFRRAKRKPTPATSESETKE